MKYEEIEELINSVNEYIPSLINGINSVCKEVYSNKLNETLETTYKILEGYKWICDAVNLTSQYHGYEIDKEDSNVTISEIVRAYENEDSILVIDILKYEILPILQGLI